MLVSVEFHCHKVAQIVQFRVFLLHLLKVILPLQFCSLLFQNLEGGLVLDQSRHWKVTEILALGFRHS